MNSALLQRTPRYIRPRRHAVRAMRAATVIVVGNGSVGLGAAESLSRLPLGGLHFVDPGVLAAENIPTHIFSPAEAGTPKALLAAARAKKVNPELRVTAEVATLQESDPRHLLGCTVLLLATDNLAAECEAGCRTMLFGVPMVQASVDGAPLIAQQRVFSNTSGQCPCPACAYTRGERDSYNRSIRYPCGGGAAQIAGAPPTMSWAALSAFSGHWAALTALRLIVGLGKDPGNTISTFAGYLNSIFTMPLVRRADCPFSHQRADLHRLRRAVADQTAEDLARALRLSRSAFADALVTVDHLSFCVDAVCPCGHRWSPRRFVPGGASVVCPACSRKVPCAAPCLIRNVPGRLLLDAGRAPLRTLCAAEPRYAVVVRSDGRSVLLYHQGVPS